MSYLIEDIAKTLKTVRERKGLSQRALSARSGVPQGHISRIENGAVDLRMSSLVALARALDLELTLVPRKAVSAVKLIVRRDRSAADDSVNASREALKELKRLQNSVSRHLQDYPATKELAQLQRQVRALQNFKLSFRELAPLHEANKAMKAFRDSVEGNKALAQTLNDIQKMRNMLAHHVVNMPSIELPRPAYSLDEDDHD